MVAGGVEVSEILAVPNLAHVLVEVSDAAPSAVGTRRSFTALKSQVLSVVADVDPPAVLSRGVNEALFVVDELEDHLGGV